MKLSEIKSSNSPVGMASYLLISEYRKMTGGLPSGLFFNKVISLLYSDLKANGVDLKLPHCWYRYGDEVVRYLMPYSLKWDHGDVSRTIVDWDGPIPNTLGEDTLTLELKKRIKTLVERYSRSGSVEDAVDEVYKRAPFEFQRKFRKFRILMRDAGRRDGEYASRTLLPAIIEACETFPLSEFPDVGSRLPVFRTAVTEIFAAPAPNIALADELSEEFWNWFCYFLRLHPDAHENITRETLEYWESQLETRTDEFDNMLGDHLIALSEENLALARHPELGPLIEKRKRDLADLRELVGTFKDDFEGFDDFLDAIKKGYGQRH